MKRLLKYLGTLRQAISLERVLKQGDSDQAARLIPFFYYFMVFIAYTNLEGLNHQIANPRGILEPRWPIFWAQNLDHGLVVSAIIIFFVLSSVLAAVFYKVLAVRMLAFLGMLQFHAYNSSFGYPNHQWDVWLFVSFIFIFFPNIWTKKVAPETKKKFLLVFWTAQAYLLLTYSMSGLGKIYDGVGQALEGQANSFSIDAAALHISNVLYMMQENTPLGPLIVSYPILGWIPFLGVILLELFSLYAAFKPSLHRPWAVTLILFHLSTYLTMRAVFVAPVALLLVLLLSSPFPAKPWSKVASDLPLLGFFASKIFKKYLVAVT